MTPNNPMNLDRIMPHDVAAEQGVLGSIFLAPRMLDEVAPILKPMDFFHKPHRRVYEVSTELHNSNKIVDVMLVKAALEATGEFETLGGMSLLLDITEALPTATNAVWYATAVRDKAILREIAAAATEALSDAYDPSADPQGILGRSVERFGAISERRVADQACDITAQAGATLEGIYKRQSGEAVRGLSSPWPDLDRRKGCWRNGALYVVAARPGQGKTSFALNAVTHVAEILRQPVGFFSLEMSYQELCERIISAKTGVDGEAIRDGKIHSSDMPKIIEAANEVSNLTLWIDDSPSRSMLDIASRARDMKRKGRLSMLVVDHLGLVQPENTRDNRQEQVSKIARRLKTLAKELDIPILALAQMNREADKRTDHKPKLSDIRESGAIEQDADAVLFVHRESEYRPDDPNLAGKAEIIVAKNRGGRTCTVPLVWNAPTTSFLSSSREWEGLE
jgi:replicative DNA helicase